jgi:putative transposase
VSRSSSKQVTSVNLSPERLDLLTRLLVEDAKEIIAQGINGWIQERQELLAQLLINREVLELVGDRGEHNAERECVRWGKQDGSALLSEQRVPLKKPRVRTRDRLHEVELQTYAALNTKDFLNEQATAKLLSGLSTRRFEKTLSKHLRGRGVGRQAVSERGIAEMTNQLEEFQTRSLAGLDVIAVFMDGIHLGDDVYVAAVGIDSTGKRHVLGFESGSTEYSGICRALLSRLIDRGVLDESGGILFIIDGGKGLRKAIKDVFGKRVHVQRCIIHKRRNVEEKLPQKLVSEFRQKFNAAYAKESHKDCEEGFVELRNWLILHRRPAAAASLLEGQLELLTLHKLGISGVLRKSLCTTNCIESLFSAARYYMRNVKRWHGEQQMNRWIASGLLEAEKNLRKIPGYSQLQKLKQAL